jgi:hypothetical protein
MNNVATKTVTISSVLESSVLSRADFVITPGNRSGELNLTMKSGEKYTYHGVPESTYLNMMHADSHGSYFNAHIKSEYKFTKQ